MTKENYQGFSNRDTWLAHLWLNNEENLYNAFRRVLFQSNPVKSIDIYNIVKSGLENKTITDPIDLSKVDWLEIEKANRE